MGIFKKQTLDNCKENKKEENKPLPSKKSTSLKIVDENFEKLEYERFKKLLSEKIKDPKMAKKAALIISEMLKNSK
jgi:predicted transcriptional regulator